MAAIPLQITWRGIQPSAALEADIRRKAAKLEQFSHHILRCKVMVEASHRHHHQGNLYRLHLVMTLPHREIVITRDPAKKHAHEDMYVAIRDAFDAAGRQVQDYARHRQGNVKQHALPLEATIARVFPKQDYGFITSADGDDVYFHRNAVINADFDKLKAGDVIHYVAQMGEEGWQAKQVSLAKQHAHSA